MYEYSSSLSPVQNEIVLEETGLITFFCFLLCQQVSSYQKSQPDPNCHTQCGDFDCRCVTSLKPLAQVDHLLFQTESGQTLTCLCGDFLVSSQTLNTE